jgi:glyoxylate reductase
MDQHDTGRQRVFVTRRIVGDALARLERRFDVDVWPGDMPPSPEALRAGAAQADGLLCMLTDRIDGELLDVCPRLRVVSNYAVGTDNVDLAACAERGVPVGRTPDVLTDATADLTWALILAVTRCLPEAAAAVRDGGWRTFGPATWLGAGLGGRTLGIVGFGRIGQAVARRAEPFGMEVIHTSRSNGLPLEDVLARADVLSLHAPLTPETRGLIDARALERMKPGAYLINTARGPLVDQFALAKALRAGHLAGAGLDVTDPEPLPPTDPLLDAPNLLVLPHIGSATVEARSAMTELAVANLEAGLAGRPLPHPAVR